MDDLESVKLEAAILGSIIESTTLNVADIISVDMFTLGLHQKLYECLKQLYEETGSISKVQLYHRFCDVMNDKGDDLKQNYLDIAAQSSAIVKLNLREHAKTLSDLYQKRLLRKLFSDLTMDIDIGNKNATDIASRALSEATKIISASSKDNSINIKKSFEDIYNSVSAPEPAYKAKTGISLLDAGTDGGFQKGRVYSFLAPAKCGKTMLATTISNSLCDSGHKHLFVCAEMGSNEIAERMLGQRIELPTKTFRERKDPEMQDIVAKQVVKIKGNVIFENEPGIDFDRLKAIVEKHIHRNKIEGFILDYYQLVSGQERHQSQAQHLEDVANWIHRVCKKNNIWCLLLVQANSEGQVLGSRGLDRACDQKYMIERPLDEQGDPEGEMAWLKMKLSRYTPLYHLGSKSAPTLRIHPNGTHFVTV